MGAEPLAESCKLAFEVARQGVEANPPIDPPASMRSFLYVAQLPRRAMTVAHRVIDTDPEFRERVAAQATEAKVGTAGFLWLHRPDGWESSFSALTGESVEQTPPPPPPAPQAERPAAADVTGPEAAAASIPPPPAPPAPEPVPTDVTQPVPVNPLAPVAAPPAPAAPSAETPMVEPPVEAQPPTAFRSEPAAVPQPPAPASERPAQPKTPDLNTGRSEIENELASLRGLVDRLADERQNVGSSVENLETEVVERRAESSALTTQLDSVSTDLQRARNERDAALTEKEEATGRQVVAERELADLRAELSAARIQLTRFETEKGDVVSDLASAQETAAALEIQISQFDAERLALRQQMESVVGERDEAWSAMADLRTERDALADRVRVAEQARIDLEAELGEVSTNWQDLQVELRNLAGQRQAVETELNELQQARQISDNERQTIFTELASTLGRVEAERDLLAGKLDAAQARLHGTRTALDSASASIHGELDGVDAAFGETAKASAGLDEAVRDASQRLSEIEAEVAANPVAGSVPVPSVANLDMPDSTMPDIAIGGIAEEDPGQLDDLDPFAGADLPGADLPGADLPGAEASPELIPDVVSSESDPLQGVEGSATVEDTAPAADAAVAPDAEPDDVVLFGEAVPVDPAIADPVADDLISVDPVVVDPVVVDPVDVDPIAADSFATEVVVEASAEGENPSAEVAAPEPTVETPSMEAPSFDAPSMPEPPMVDSSAEGEPGDIAPPPAPTQSLDDVMESHGLGAGESPDEAVEPVSERAQISPIAGDTVAMARHAVSTPDVVILLDGDPIAEMGWPTLSVVERREALVGYLGNLAAETGAASDVVFEGRVGSESDLPISRAVRVRLTHTTIEAVDAVKEVIDEYPLAWPVVVVSDDPRMAAIAKTAGASMLDNGQLLDLFLANA